MQRDRLPQAEPYTQRNRRRRIWQKVVGGLACAVVFCTTYALILPAITMEKETICGLEEHTHTEACYAVETVGPTVEFLCSSEGLADHVHDWMCYDGDGALSCGYADFVIHTHDDLCYDENGNLICPLPEIRAHEHDADCYQERLRLTCGQEETGHVHDKSCYTRYRGELACGLEETEGHTHDADCYQTIRELACGLEESAEHAHDDSCYRERTELICSLPETEGHTHTDDCYDWISELTCGLEEIEGHIHDESCYTAETVLTCRKQEAVPHTHDAGCFDENGALICGRTETLSHRHTEDCLLVSADTPEETRVLICGKQEHAHTDACYPPETDSGESEDWEAVMKELGLTGEYRQDVLTVAESQLGVQESEIDVITTADGESKGYTRYGDWYGDPYGDWCAMFASFCLHYAQVPEKAFPQEANCEKWIAALQKERFDLYREALPDDDSAPYVPSPGDLVFFSTRSDGHADHVGLVAEWIPGTEDEPDAIRVIEGNSNDRVQYVTYELPDDRILGYGELPEQTFYCGLTGHVHGDDCRNFWGQLDCDLEEHIHTEACTLAPGEQPPTVQTFTGEDFTVRVEYGADAELPEGVTLAVEEIPADSAEYQLYFSQSIEAMEADQSAETVVFARFFDIRFEQNGQTLEPAAPVSVTITYDTVADADLPANCRSIHFGSEGTELLPAETEELDAGEFSFTHTQDSFSVVGNLMTVDYSVDNSTDVGPSRLPVDYFVCVDGEWVCAGSTKTGWYGTYPASDWTDYNRDYITVGQAESVLGRYGFDPSDTNPARRIAYQQKYGDTKIYSDTNTVEINGNRVIPLSRNASHAGFNVYFLPKNIDSFKSIQSPDNLGKASNSFYTVQVYDPNHLVYQAGEEPETRLILTGGSANVTVNPLPADAACAWACVGTDWSTVAAGTTNADGTITFELTNITQPLRITPMTNNLGTPSDQLVHYYVYLDGQWTEVGTTSTIYRNTDLISRYFVTSSQVESVLAPYGFRSATYSYSDGQGNCLAHQSDIYGFGDTFWVDNDSRQLSDGTWAIGLSYDDTAYKLYYLPGNTERFTDKTPNSYAADSARMANNRFWSVTVRDDAHHVYDGGELNSLHWAVLNGGELTVIVRNAEGVIWSCVGKNGETLNVNTTQTAGQTTFTFTDITQPVEIIATRSNPTFTVQYYANIPRFATSGSNPLKIIDTSGEANGGKAALPTNGGSMPTRNLYLEGIGRTTGQNAGNATELHQVATTTELTKLYTEATYQYESHPGLAYFNKLKDNESYTLQEIWILKTGKTADSTNRDDWDVYPYTADTAFTNEASQAVGDTILIADGAVIRLVSGTSTGNYYNGTTFYDYNISSGQNSDGRWRTGITGINIEANYGTSRNGQRTWRSGADVFAFGNANCGTGMSGYLFDESYLNKYSSKNSNYGGCTFKLVDGLNDDGTIRYNEWIVAPNLFNDGGANGKQTYAGSSLTFNRVGDTYTLSAATLNNSNGQSNTLSGLQYFFHPSPTSSTTHTHIFTNNFWPMDQAAGRTDALWGKYSSPGSFQGFVETNDYNWSSLAKDFPPSDDGNAHNWFFGMNFALSFNLTADYEGPLEYTFFGDDDLWVFLDKQLICDIGGVHSSVGEFVNLRDYLPVGSSGQHTLSFFYTERGASGSTCYMSFTLPSVSSAVTERDTGSLKIAKSLEGTGTTDYSGEEYKFQVELLADENGSPLNQTFSYSRTDGTNTYYGTIKSGDTIPLHQNEVATITGLPAGTYYRVTELSHDGYLTTVNGNEGYIVSGKIATGEISSASFVNTPYHELPETGGPGIHWITISGLALMAVPLMVWILRKRRGAV